MTSYLRLETGEEFRGEAFGHIANVTGELVFSTGMSGYVESLTDPSYKNQILVLTYPLVGNYGVPDSSYFESKKIHLAGLIVAEHCKHPNHWTSQSTLNDWLKKEGVVSISNIDCRALTKIIREHGVVRAQITTSPDTPITFDWHCSNLVDLVSTPEPQTFIGTGNVPRDKVRILVVDCGLKENQLRCLLKYNVELLVVPHNSNLIDITKTYSPHRLFISNGPGDPQDCQVLIQNLQDFLTVNEQRETPIPIFGICLGHQILSLASGASTYKLPYGNRGLNIPCRLVNTNRCYITSQNHGYAVDTSTLQDGWSELFVNANDNSNEGVYHTSLPYFSVQFHPEGSPGPQDTEFLFELFVCDNMRTLIVNQPLKTTHNTPKKILVLGSGGLSIGQSGEFDYSGSQALKAYKEAGHTTVLINPNVATIQTSPGLADKVYFLPVDFEYVVKVIKVERPDAITVSFGGQTALNCGVKLYQQGILEKYAIEILGSPIESVIMTEDRKEFKKHIDSIGYSCIPSKMVNSVADARTVAAELGYPLLIRASYALGGFGSGFANCDDDLIQLVNKALLASPQVIIDRSLWGWKELEYEVVRDRYGNCICVCNMENIDPLGIHTGDSMVVAPSQTLDDHDYQSLRSCAIKVIQSLGIVGECNIQFALDPNSRQFYVIEVNARLSRSSALASKATGYPLAYVAAKLSLGECLVNIKNRITQTTTCCFEPALDYCVIKVPRWDIRKFPRVDGHLDSAMKSIGEAMAIGRSFEETFQKALRMADESVNGFESGVVEATQDILANPTNKRVLAIADAMAGTDFKIKQIAEHTQMDFWFLHKMRNIIVMEKRLESQRYTNNGVPVSLLFGAKRLGFSDRQIGKWTQHTELVIRNMRLSAGIMPTIKQIDTVAAEFPCYTNYLYTTYNSGVDCNHDIVPENPGGLIVLGSGVYKIGSSVEFDWCCVNAVRELRRHGKTVSMVNCNPETVSTDYDEADRLYFEELSVEQVMNIYELEAPDGIVLCMGGQISNNIAMSLFRQKVKVLGTSPENIDIAENRYKFSRLLDRLDVQQPEWKELTSFEEAMEFCNAVQYPCLIRPSYVLSGAAMHVCYNDKDLVSFLQCAVEISRDHPVVISKYIQGAKEIEVDAIASGGVIHKLAVSEHVENAGVHSGDSTLILPAQDVNKTTLQRVQNIVEKLAKAIDIKGPFNMQFIVKDDQVKVIECNLRVSRSFPFVSKTLNVNMIQVAIDVMLDKLELITPKKLVANAVGVKVPKFSFSRLPRADFSLGVEMVSTGEVACYGINKYDAYLKALQSSDVRLPSRGSGVLISLGTFRYKAEFLEYAKILQELGYVLYATRGTCDYLRENNVQVSEVLYSPGREDDPLHFHNLIKQGAFELVVNVSRPEIYGGQNIDTIGYKIRRTAIDNGILLMTDVKGAKLLVQSLQWFEKQDRQIFVNTTIDCLTSYKTVRLPGLIDVHVHLREPGAEYKEDWSTGTASALAGGITTVCAMPNTDPAVTDVESLELVEKLAESKAYCDYGIFVGANNTNTNSIGKYGERAAALKMYLNNTYGPLLLSNMLDWREHLCNWRGPGPVCVHAEGQTMGAVLYLAKLVNTRVHVCHVAKREEIEMIRMAKESGQSVTCEVAPHHLFLDENHNESLCGCSNVKPPLMTKDDQNALWENMDIIDCFATDHAPHTVEEKRSTNCPGFPGLETALPLLLTAVNEGRLTLDDIVEKYHTNPKRIFDLTIDDEETYIEIDLDREWVIGERKMQSKCDWTPFKGTKVCGMVRRVVLRGKVVYVDGHILAKPGYGVNLRTNTQQVTRLQQVEQSVVATSAPQRAIASGFKWYHILSVEQFTRGHLKQLFDTADEMRTIVTKQGTTDILSGKVLGLIFYEPSTRTKGSFAAAMQRLGGKILEIGADESSAKKGESFSDYVKCIECYTDAIVIRNGQSGSLDEIARNAGLPILNAGDGSGEHPTQALLDIYTIRRERGTVNGLTIALVGDLKHGRTVHSLAKLLAIYNVNIRYVSPPGLEMPQEIMDYVKQRGINQTVYNTIDDVLEDTDILYMTRIQKERFEMTPLLEFAISGYQITPKNLTKAKENLVIMHPLPRVKEISPALDNDPRAAYFRQMQNGMFVRMALLKLVFDA